MDTFLVLDKLKDSTAEVFEKGHKQRTAYFRLINGVVSIAQEARLAKNYELSDDLRDLLELSGVKVIQGTAGYEYKDIPEALKGRPIGDTWQFTK